MAHGVQNSALRNTVCAVFATLIVQLFYLNKKNQALLPISETVHVGLCQTWSEIPKPDYQSVNVTGL